jgi:large conductance mechanosensitive channel
MPDSAAKVFKDVPNSFGAFLNAVIAFVILAAVVYFFVVVPYTKAKERFFPSEEEGTPADVALLQEIRDLLATRGGSI